jgi:glucose/arabinose dehydrogenase
MIGSLIGARQQLLRLAAVALIVGGIGGCTRGPRLLAPQEQLPLDRQVVEYPRGFALTSYVENLTAPTAIAFDRTDGPHAGALLIAEGGLDGNPVRIFGFDPSGEQFTVYPLGRRLGLGLLGGDESLHGPVGGMVVHAGEIYVTHRDSSGRGVVSALTYDGARRTVVGDLPAQGDYGVTDIVVNETNGRLYFGVGSATNSGVVGIDNWDVGWVEDHPDFSDVPFVDLTLLGYRFDTPNPAGGLFGGADKAVSAPYQPFGTSNQTRIRRSPSGRPTSAIYSVSPEGGDLRVEAHGLRNPAGLAFNEFGSLFATNQGMQLRGTRPVKDDPDVVTRVPLGGATWFGFPDFSADMYPITDARFQPPVDMIIQTGYPELAFLINHSASGLTPPDRNTLLRAVFPSLSGASKMQIVPSRGPFSDFGGNLVVALAGDRAPFATSGRKLAAPVGYKVVRVDPDSRQVREFVHNTSMRPASAVGKKVVGLERPIDVAFGTDGALYILDLGRLEMRSGNPRIAERTGRVFRLAPAEEPTTPP